MMYWRYNGDIFLGNMTNKMFCLLWSARLSMRKVSSNLLLPENGQSWVPHVLTNQSCTLENRDKGKLNELPQLWS